MNPQRSRYHLLGYSEAQQNTHRMVEELLDQQPRLNYNQLDFLFRTRGRFRNSDFSMSPKQQEWLEALHKQYCSNPIKQEIARATRRRHEDD